VADFPNPVESDKEVHLKRTFTLTASKPVANLYYRAAAGNKIAALAGGWYQIDGTWKVKVHGAAPKVRKSGGKMELLVPVAFKDGKARFVQEYAW
jgi:hypothetical protein